MNVTRAEPTRPTFFFSVISGPNMNSNVIKLYMDKFYTQRDFHRVQEHSKWSLDEEVMAI